MHEALTVLDALPAAMGGSEEHARALQTLDCELGQGYLFGRAESGADVTRSIEAHVQAGRSDASAA